MKGDIIVLIIVVACCLSIGFAFGSRPCKCEPTIDLNQDGKKDIQDYSIFMHLYDQENQ